ncbi:MAG: GNAT family N-acetyltransferase [Deltaproteobacteria bacterium]|nr:GNAT family N-acetyltransferase [Deltaproteobacteria bacterium]
MALKIRPATLQDAPALAATEREIARTPGLLASRPHELSDGKFAAKIAELATAEGGRYLVAEMDGAIVGHAMLDPLALEVTRHVVQLTLAVHPGWQGKGIGKALLTALLAWARAAPGVEKVELRARSGNAVALALYQKLGFVEEGRLQRRIRLGPGQYLDDIAMGLCLKP